MKKLLIIILVILLALCASCTLNLADAPTFEPASGTVGSGSPLSVSINNSVENSQIRYTIDETDPTYESALYDGPIVISKNTVLKAAAFKSKRMVSAIATTQYYVKSATPTTDVEAGTYDSGKQIPLVCTTPGASIYYTIDGSTPDISSPKYTEPITLTKNTTLKAIAASDDFSASEELSVTYSIKAAKPTANVSAGNYCVDYGSTEGIVLSCDTEDADIYYTLDGSDPATSSARKKYSQAIVFSMSIPIQKVLKMYATSQSNVDSDINTVTFMVYFKGPAGGYVFYDCDADNDSTNDGAGSDNLKSSTCGWRYLEAAPADITVGTTTEFTFGFYRTSADGTNLYANGTTVYEEGTLSETDGKSTGTAIGTGRANTNKLVKNMKLAAYTSKTGNGTTADYAARLCDVYSYGGCNDWFLPSKDELHLMYTNLKANDLGGFSSTYWSSSESDKSGFIGPALNACVQYVDFCATGSSCRDNSLRVRAVRTFMILPSTN